MNVRLNVSSSGVTFSTYFSSAKRIGHPILVMGVLAGLTDRYVSSMVKRWEQSPDGAPYRSDDLWMANDRDPATTR